MPRFFNSEPAEAVLTTLESALDVVDFGIVLLNRDLDAYFINRRFEELWKLDLAPALAAPAFGELLRGAAAAGLFDVSEADLPGYLDEQEALVRAGSIPPSELDFADGRRLLFRCVASPDGGRVLTYVDISRELRNEASVARERVSADVRFNAEVLEEQAAYLATLAEAADEHAQAAAAARLVLEHEVTEHRQLEAELRRLATIDSLTGAFNRAEFLASAERELAVRQGPEHRMVVLMVDVDHLKAINDRFGHAGGDLALQHLVIMLRAGLRQRDLIGRLGGEEFVVLLPDTPPDAARMVAERLRAGVADTLIAFGGGMIGMTVSVGLAIQQATDRSIEQIMARADDALCRAKSSGRNKVVADLQPVVA